MFLAKTFQMNLKNIAHKTKSVLNVLYSEKYLVFTNTVVGSSLMMVGDAMAQKLEARFGHSKNNSLDFHRMGRLGLLGGVCAFYQHYFYLILDRHLPGIASGTIIKKIIIDEMIMGTTSVSFFFLANGYFETRTIDGAINNLYQLFLPAYLADLCYWPIFQAINFYFIPPRFRITYLSCVTLAWNAFLCFLHIHKNRSLENKKNLDENEKSA